MCRQGVLFQGQHIRPNGSHKQIKCNAETLAPTRVHRDRILVVVILQPDPIKSLILMSITTL